MGFQICRGARPLMTAWSTTQSSKLLPRTSLSTTASLILRRTLMSSVVEVDLDSPVPEKPVTFILGEDHGFYGKSWLPSFQEKVPKEHGMQFGSFALDPQSKTFDDALNELKRDAGSFVDTVFVARGPFMSWMAQFYLEDLPFKGLVMVDPMQLDDQNGVNQFQLQYDKLGLTSSQQYEMFLDFDQHWGHWTYQLEPGVVPMMIMYTADRPMYKRCAENTALRHSLEDDLNDIPIVKMPATKREHDEESLEAIVDWINDRAL